MKVIIIAEYPEITDPNSCEADEVVELVSKKCKEIENLINADCVWLDEVESSGITKKVDTEKDSN